jgi:hypothetical protein
MFIVVFGVRRQKGMKKSCAVAAVVQSEPSVVEKAPTKKK